VTAGVLFSLGKAFSLISVLAVGGASAAAPEIQRIVVDRHHWMSAAEFSRAFAIAQAAPGPNVMLASLIGWRVAGIAGLGVATLCMNAPSAAIAFVVGRGWRRWAALPWVLDAQRTLAFLAVGLITAGGVRIARTADTDLVAAGLTVAVAAFVILTRRNPLWALVAAAAAGVARHRLGFGG
jgi:chromate transporter